MKADVAESMVVLCELQVVDNGLSERQRLLADLSMMVSEKTIRVKDLAGQKTGARERIKRVEADLAKRELDIKTYQEKIAKFNTQLNIVKNQKEYDAILHEIAAEETDSSRAEDDVLEMMTELDDLKDSIKLLEKSLAEAEQDVARERDKANEEVHRVSMDMRQLRSERQALVSRLDDELCRKYERILHNKHDCAMAEVIEHTCAGCRMGVTKQNLARLIGGKEIIQCPNCMRILYLKGEQ